MVQRRLEFLKAVRLVRYVLDDFVCWASCEGLHCLRGIFVSSEIPETKSVIQRRLEFVQAIRFGRDV